MAVWTGSGLWSLYVFLVHLSEVDWLPVEMQAVPDALVWGKPPDRGDTTPRHEPGTGREQSRNTPLGG